MQRLENLHSSNELIPHTVEKQGEMASNGHTVLVVEDEGLIAGFIQLALESEGFKVIVRFNGIEAIETIDSGVEFNCLLTDITMPGKSGFEVIDHLRETRGRDFPVIIQSAVSDGETEKQIREYNPFASLPKPYGLDSLLEAAAAGCEDYAKRHNGHNSNES